ncbi:MAG: hypothetical protein AAB392_02650 [Patescibacteria group bacterium]
MKLLKFEFKKSTPKLGSLHKNLFNPSTFWAISLVGTGIVIILGSIVGVQYFRSVYFENYKNVTDVSSSVESEMNIAGLENNIQRRNALIQKQIVIPKDPSI